jgi:hypothetical protein
MKLLIFVILVMGVFLITYGIYEEKLRIAKEKVKVEYRFIPRSYYEEQLFDSNFGKKLAPLFEEDSQWYERNVGREIGFNRLKRS